MLSLLDADATNNALQVAGAIRGTSSVLVEGYATYNDDTIDFSDVAANLANPLYADAVNFSNAAARLNGALGVPGGITALVRPGIEDRFDRRHGADGRLGDLAAWRFNGQPGVLLRCARAAI